MYTFFVKNSSLCFLFSLRSLLNYYFLSQVTECRYFLAYGEQLTNVYLFIKIWGWGSEVSGVSYVTRGGHSWKKTSNTGDTWTVWNRYAFYNVSSTHPTSQISKSNLPTSRHTVFLQYESACELSNASSLYRLFRSLQNHTCELFSVSSALHLEMKYRPRQPRQPQSRLLA